MCGHHELLPGALKVQIRYGRPSNPLYRGGYADVWKGRYRGQDMAVKVIRTYATDDLREITHVRCSISVPGVDDDALYRGSAKRS